MAEKLYNVYLDPAKCLSYTFASGKKVVAGKNIQVPESEVEQYKSNSLFNVNPVPESQLVHKKEVRENPRAAKNPEDRETETEKEKDEIPERPSLKIKK